MDETIGDGIMSDEMFLFGFFGFIIFICIAVVIVVAATVSSTIGGINDDEDLLEDE